MRGHLRTVFAKRDDPYAGVDLANASRFGGGLWFVGALLVASIMPFVPPDEAIGNAGWIVAGLMMASGLVAGRRMRAVGPQVNPTELLLYSYLAVVSITVLVWLSGGIDSPYAQLFVVSALYTCAAHPARRALAYLVVFLGLALLPLAYADHLTRREATEHVVELTAWLALSLAVILLMHNVRMQRLGLRREGEQARRQARADPLTGLLNRRAFDEDLAHAIEAARVSGEPLSVLVADLDDFKDFNDQFGHLEGDRVLQAVAEALGTALRRPDVAYRWGGDEFAVILPRTDGHGAELVARRLQGAVARSTGPHGQALGITTGVAEYDRSDRSGAVAMLAAADQALMHAKGSGVFELPQARR